MPRLSLVGSPISASAPTPAGILGRPEPRLWTPPLRELTPATSYGFDLIDFADRIRRPFYPWQKWLAIHGGELLPDGRPRFRIMLVLVARQNGKTEFLVVLSLFWQFVEHVPMILGTSTKLDYARESWHKAVKLADKTPDLDTLHAPGRRWKREANGEQESWTLEESRYKIAASNEEGGRSLTINRGIFDELRQHHDYSAWAAMEPALSPPDAQAYALSNAGDDRSVVLNELRDDALRYINTGHGDPRLGLAEWSSPPGADPEDVDALAQANPSLGHYGDLETLLAHARRVKAKGGEALSRFKTEKMCISVSLLNPAIDPGAWSRCYQPGGLDDYRRDVVTFIDVAPDQLHATLYAGALMPDDRVRLDFVREWEGVDAADQAARDLPDLMAQIRPRALGWLPGGPAASMAADMRRRRRARAAGDGPPLLKWPPRGVKLVEIKSDVPAVCMSYAKNVAAERVAHSGDPLLNAQTDGTQPLRRGDGVWVFSRRGTGHCDAVYAAAGVDWLARTMPPRPRAVVLVPRTQ